MSNDHVLACTIRPWAAFPFERALTGMRAAGFSAVALPVHGVEQLITPDTSADDAARVAGVIAAHDLELAVLSHAAALDRTDGEALAATRRQIDHCRRLGVNVLVDMGCTQPAHYGRYFDLMRATAPYAADQGVVIAVKPHGGLSATAADTHAAIERVGHDAYRVCFDPGNLLHYSGESLDTGLAQLAPLIVAVGVRDHPGRPAMSDGHGTGMGGGMAPPVTPGNGVVDFPSLYRTLHEHGFSGPSAVETLNRADTAEAIDDEARKAHKYLSPLVAGR